MAIDHDRLFKELLQTFFIEFIELFFPDLNEAIDFNQVKFLSEELFTDIVAGKTHKVDVLIETKLKDEDALIIVHFESQAQYQADFSERMFLYFCRLFEKYRRRIIPIAIFSYDAVKAEPEGYEMKFLFKEILKFHYYKLELRKENWRDYIKHNNPVAAALLSKMKYTKEDRVQVKKEFLRMIMRLELDPARIRLIYVFFDSYLTLNNIEESKLREEMKALDPLEEAKIMDMRTNWEKTAELKGKLEGKLEGEQKMLKKFIQAHFGEASREMLAQISALTDLEILDDLTDQLFQNSDLVMATKCVNEAYLKQKSLE